MFYSQLDLGTLALLLPRPPLQPSTPTHPSTHTADSTLAPVLSLGKGFSLRCFLPFIGNFTTRVVTKLKHCELYVVSSSVSAPLALSWESLLS